MEHLQEVISAKTLGELEPAAPKAAVPNILEPTKAEIESIIALMISGVDNWEIKRTVRREVDVKGTKAYPGFTQEQIKEIRAAVEARIAELKASEPLK